MADAHANFAYGTVLTAPSPATSGTSVVLNSGQGTTMPTPPFNATVWPAGVAPTQANAEIWRCTAVATDTLTITRAQESTTARAVVVGDQVAVAVTAKVLTDIETAAAAAQTTANAAAVKANNLSDLASASTARSNLGLGSAATQASSAFEVAGAAATEQTRATAAEALAALKANNLSDLASASSARTNLGLGSAATHPSTDFEASGESTRALAAEALLAPKASPAFTGLMTFPTGGAPWGITQTKLIQRLNYRSKSPAAHGLSFWTCAPEDCNASAFAYGTQNLTLVRLYDLPAQTITNLWTAIGTNGASLTLVNIAAFTISGTTATQVAITADQHAAFNSGGQSTKGPYAVNSGTPYSFAGGDLMLGILQVGTTTAQLFGQNTGSSNTAIMNVNLSQASGNWFCGLLGSQATMPSSIDLTTVALSGVAIWMGAS